MNNFTGLSLPPGGTVGEDREWTTEEAFKYCGQISRNRFSRVPFNPCFLSRGIRPHFESISAFCLYANEFSNSPAYLDTLRPFFIENWESQLLQCVWRKPKNPVFIALRDTISRFDLPVRTLQDLLACHKFDFAGRRYSHMPDLKENYLHSSKALGRLILQMLGHREPEIQDLSDSFCSGVHMAHLWKNLPRDLERGRNYIPEENRRKSDYNEQDLLAGHFNSGFRLLMADLVAETRDLLLKSRPLCGRIDPRVRFETTRIWNGGIQILDRIEQGEFNVFNQNPDFTFKEHLMIFFRAALPSLNSKRNSKGNPTGGSKKTFQGGKK